MIVGLVVTLMACGGSDGQETTSGVASAPGAASGAVTVPPVLDFSAPLVDGTDFDLRAYAGEPVVFWFWAPY